MIYNTREVRINRKTLYGYLRYKVVKLYAKIVGHKLDLNLCVDYQTRLNNVYYELYVDDPLGRDFNLVYSDMSDLQNEFKNFSCVEKCFLDHVWKNVGFYNVDPNILKEYIND